MAVISGSQQTIAEGAAGTAFASAGASFILDVDSSAAVRLETRRSSTDASWKPVRSGMAQGSASVIDGPASVAVTAVTGREYRVVCVRGLASVAADQ